ncbi:energy transducer TonB [Flavobacterium aquatile]|uniref:Energy transducer TonB n=1 Tax=Flavobacterium aquatile LMG 4008 = ATCC 11947 TaxID=1453498 RepID=A0A095SYI5_9FLAO|nr:energy transducer TonB [Flavobacterium aquatile]KGD69454.1 energy transducer TonB [Flavobacterium aquatile LMG 4008 = ATCC 11947]OXA66090.1 energy transducer TonB [Flavobacterium aquatile] [Flavobacterium aquatile LMG 4008 = ATCC 11947]GEC77573.1 biopolymer transporter TonB [Flavobacterium aquatile]
MKIDLFENKWLDIVFEGRNKSYGAYDLRKKNTSTNIRAFIIGAVIFAFAVATPMLMELIPDSSDEDTTLNDKIVTVKLPPKEEKPKENIPPPPPPPPKVDQVKFVKPVVAKTNEVTEEPPKVEEIKDKNLGKEDIKGDPNADLVLTPPGDGPKQAEVTEDNTIYNSAGIEVKPEFPGGIQKWYSFLKNNFQAPDEPGLKGKVIVSFVVEKDGSLTDIKVLRDIGFGTGKEAERVLKKGPRWTPAEQNGKKVRCSFIQTFSVETPEE